MRATLQRKLKKTDTVERCGLILNDGTVITTANVHENPENGFAIPVRELAKHEANLYGSWHTHVDGKSSVLSSEDYAGFSQWPDLTHFIVGADGVRAYRVIDGVIREVD